MRPSFKGLRRIWQRPDAPLGVILMYHRVASVDLDPWRLCVTPENFADQLRAIAEVWRTSSVAQLADMRRAGSAEPAVAITFDDGYADNLLHAQPALARFEVPATFFLTSGTLGSTREFWWDELERLLLQPGTLPATFHLTLDGKQTAFQAGAAAKPVPKLHADVRATLPWEAAPDTRLGFYYSIWQRLRPLGGPARLQALTELREQLEMPDSARASHRTLTAQEALDLANAPRVDIGAHSVTHAAASALTPEQQRWEMSQSRRDLESLTGRPVHGFAYPYGDIDRASAQLARETGFRFACTTEVGRVTSRSDPHLLPRLPVEDCQGSRLVATLRTLLA